MKRTSVVTTSVPAKQATFDVQARAQRRRSRRTHSIGGLHFVSKLPRLSSRTDHASTPARHFTVPYLPMLLKASLAPTLLFQFHAMLPSDRQSQPTSRRANRADLADLAHRALVFGVILDAIKWAGRALFARVDWRERGSANIKLVEAVEFDFYRVAG